MSGRPDTPLQSLLNRILFRYRLALSFLTGFLFIQLLVKLLYLLKARLETEVVLEIEIPAQPSTPAAESLLLDTAPPEVVPGFPVVEAELSFEVAVTVEVGPAVPDIYTPLPPELVLESGEPMLTADGKILRYQFNWQNPVLRERIYPFRKEKLLDFLLYFTEIDLVQDFKARGMADPSIQAKIDQSKAAMAARRREITNRFTAELAKKKVADVWFGKVTGATPKTERFRQTYYIDQKLNRLHDKLDTLIDRKTTLLKRIAWWPSDLHRQEEINQQVSKLEMEEIAPLQAQLEDWKNFRELFNQMEALPGDEVTVQDVLRWELNQKKEAWVRLEQDQLLKEILLWINRQPDRFPEWLVYMVVHFSGMRYMSAHGSFADPRLLLETFEREDLDDEVKSLTGVSLMQACKDAIQRLLTRTAAATPQQKLLLDRLVQRLNLPDRNALLEVCTTETIEGIQKLPDDNACLQALVQYRQKLWNQAQRDRSRSPMPDWVWAEVCKYTPLRLQSSDPDWEAVSPERSKYQHNQWRTILANWEKKDITAWRRKHHESLELVVTRSVCNEIAEQIQNLRGLAPVAGLTARPVWYARQQAKDPLRAYLRQAPVESDFKPGASILWLEWVENQPNAWQVAHPLKGYSIIPGDPQASSPAAGPKKEISKKALARQKAEGQGWSYQVESNAYSRLRPLPSREEMRKQGKSEKQIAEALAQRKATGNYESEYLRWSHEATVVDVVEMIDGRYVMTFETGKIGLRLRSLGSLMGNPNVFVGYVPHANLSPEMDYKLMNMLRLERILPGVALPADLRPKRIVEQTAALARPEAVARPAAELPLRSVVIIHSEPGEKTRRQIRTFKIADSDEQQRFCMLPVVPRVLIPHGSQVSVSRENSREAVDGVFNGSDGHYLRVVKCPDNILAEGLFIKKIQTADASPGKWVTCAPNVAKTICFQFSGFDNQGKSIIIPLEGDDRIAIPRGMKLFVSTIHKDSEQDPGNGIIIGPGKAEFYVILDYRELLEISASAETTANADRPIRLNGDPTGCYVLKREVVDTTAPDDEDD